MSKQTKTDRKAAIAALQQVWPNAKLGKVSNEDLAFLLDVAKHLRTGKKQMSEILSRYRKAYEKTVAYSGNKSADNGDEVATFLRGKTPDEVVELAEKVLKLEPGFLVTKYAGLNPGQRRMNAGNRIRAAIRRGDLDPQEVLAS